MIRLYDVVVSAKDVVVSANDSVMSDGEHLLLFERGSSPEMYKLSFSCKKEANE